MSRSPGVIQPDGTQAPHVDRTSYSAFMQPHEDKVVKCIENRAATFANVSIEQFEPLQMVWYRLGQQYKPVLDARRELLTLLQHFDWFHEGDEGYPQHIVRGGQRILTFFVYLTDLKDPKDGGATIFPNVGNLAIQPTRGSAVFWYDVGLDGKGDERTLHGGAPVLSDTLEKLAINIWVREGTFV